MPHSCCAEPRQRVALVAGGSGEIGAAVVRSLCSAGALVFCGYRTRAPAAGPPSARPIHLDLSDPEEASQVCERIHAEHGHLDILVNAAAANVESPALAMSDEDWELVLQTNLSAAFRLCRAAARCMMLGHWGRIVNISSIAGRLGGRGQINYASSKAGLEAMTRVLALELGRKGVLCNCVAPGVIDTRMSARIRQEHGARLLEVISVRRFGTPEEVASVVAFLTSDSAGYINGQVLAVDGGLGL